MLVLQLIGALIPIIALLLLADAAMRPSNPACCLAR